MQASNSDSARDTSVVFLLSVVVFEARENVTSGRRQGKRRRRWRIRTRVLHCAFVEGSRPVIGCKWSLKPAARFRERESITVA